MRAWALVALLALPAMAQDMPIPADAPVVSPVAPLTPEQETLLAQRLARLEAENASLKRDTGTPWWVPVLVVAASLGVGFGVGYGVHAAAAK